VAQNFTVELSNPRSSIETYLEAFQRHDLAQCLEFFAPDATLTFVSGTYQGKAAIEDWHKDRFAANLKILRMDQITADGDTVTVDLNVTSNRLQFFKIANLDGRATMRLADGKIKELSFGLRLYDPFEAWG
jgi:ketosteroid isomerase-like protein